MGGGREGGRFAGGEGADRDEAAATKSLHDRCIAVVVVWVVMVMVVREVVCGGSTWRNDR
eukprot:6197994-Pleurochrysis_carterae.AAC.1